MVSRMLADPNRPLPDVVRDERDDWPGPVRSIYEQDDRLRSLFAHSAGLLQSERALRALGRAPAVPQFNDHHTEGVYVAHHFKRMLDAFLELRDDTFGDAPEDMIRAVRRLLPRYERPLLHYIHLHDIGKPATLQVVYRNGRRREITYENVRALDLNAQPPTYDGAALSKIVNYHEDQKHGRFGANLLQDVSLGEYFTHAILVHDQLYDVDEIDAGTFRRFFPQLNRETVHFAIAGAVLDAAGSREAGGGRDYSGARWALRSYQQTLG